MKEARLLETWYGDRPPGVLLSALERVYAGVSARRRRAATPEPDLVGRPIVVVGNITVGGTGKTPLTIRLCELLKQAGLRVAVISRGYGRDGSDPVRVTHATPAALGGDEPVLVARRCAVPVYVDRNREAAARAALGEGAEVVLSDDGLQRASLPRVLELCVVDTSRGFGNGRLLPAGPLREPAERLETVDWVIANGTEPLPDLPDALRSPPVRMCLAPIAFHRLDGDATVPVEDAPGRFAAALAAVAGMGNPERFFRTLEGLGLAGFDEHPFPDHHAFRAEDFTTLRGTVLMTEKDAVKCADLPLNDAWALRVEARLPGDWEAEFVARVRSLTS